MIDHIMTINFTSITILKDSEMKHHPTDKKREKQQRTILFAESLEDCLS